MTDGEALLRAILENPADDTARLVYADWLEEQPPKRVACRECRGKGEVRGHGMFSTGRPCLACGGSALTPHSHRKGDGTLLDPSDAERAEFIRSGIRFPGNRHSVEYMRGNAKFSPLIEWPDSMTALCGTREYQPTWRRGFVAELMMPLAAFLAHAGAMFRAHPIERVVPVCREPLELPTHYEGRFVRTDPLWELHGTVHWDRVDPAGVPWELWRAAENVPGGNPAATYEGRLFASRRDAMDWYSAACVAHGRSLAGLTEAAAWA